MKPFAPIGLVIVAILLHACTVNGQTDGDGGVSVERWNLFEGETRLRFRDPRNYSGQGRRGEEFQSVQKYWPLPRADERPTPLHFGLFVTPDPDRNPIDPPERFTGYHVATDFELLPGEEDAEVPVFAVCSGTVVFSGFASGYGGLLVQSCSMQGEEVTVLYGHVRIDPLPARGTLLRAGERISVLADARSDEAGETRKHLHLGIRRGPQLDLRGYVQRESEISHFIDPKTVLPLQE